MSTLLKLGLSGYDVKPRFGAFQCEYLLQNPLFFEEKILVTLDTHTKKINPPSIILGGGGVHGKVCWLIAYSELMCFCLVNIYNCYETKSKRVKLIKNCNQHLLNIC